MCAIHCTDANDNLIALESSLTWEVMLKADKTRLLAPVLNLIISEFNGYPVGVKYHRKCYQSFTTTQKIKFSIKDFFSKCNQMRRKLQIWSHLLKKSLMENLFFCVVYT